MNSPTIFHIPSIPQKYRQVLLLAGGKSISVIGTSLTWLLLTVLIAQEYSPTVAGRYFGIGAVFQMLVAIPIGGYLADRLSSLYVIRLQILAFIMAGIVWIAGQDGLLTYVGVGLCLFFAYGLNAAGSYLLKTTDQDAGGSIFGLFASIIAFGSFVGALVYPYFFEHTFPLIPLILLFSQCVYMYMTSYLPSDAVLRANEVKRENPYKVFFIEMKEASHFVKENSYMPLLSLGDALFEGVFYAGIWFLIPLEFAAHAEVTFFDGLPLGIYELVTIVLAGLIGFLADRLSRRRVALVGWGSILLGLWILYMWHDVYGLIFVGALIALGNNLEYVSSYHALEKYDIDHQEDGAFDSLRQIVGNLGYFLVPMVLGMVYDQHGFSYSLLILVLAVSCIAGVMIYLSRTLGRNLQA